ncbi:MAG: FAD-binding oxidoreductase [Hyphomicrobiales bacterium]|nr:FAD-binding oxidoreductase [Hyphomicrobiales bacterium]
MASPSKLRIAIVGAGIVGVSTAFFLARAGVGVRLLEAHAPAAAATGAADGAVSVASKRPGAMMNAALAGIALYRELAAQGVLDGGFVSRSTFLVAVGAAEAAVLDGHAEALASAGVEVVRHPTSALARLAPALSPEAEGAIEVRGEGHAIGYDVVRRLIRAAELTVERGVTVRNLVQSSDGGLVGLDTDRGRIEADAVVIAAGGGSAELLGLDGVLRPRRGQLLVTERAPALNAALPGAIMSARYLLSKASAKGAPVSPRGYGLVIDPLRTGQFLVGGTRENDATRPIADVEAIGHVLADAVAMVPGLAKLRLLRAFAGLRTAVVDGLPLIGRAPGGDGVFVATGFEGDGICLGPVMGRTIADALLGRPATLDLSPFDPGRFLAGRVAA